MTRKRLLTSLAVVIVAIGMFVSPRLARADNSQTAGTIDTTHTSLTYTHGPFVVPNVTDQVGQPNCTAPQMCDDFALTVNVPAGTNSSDQIMIQYVYDQSLDPEVDFDMWVYNSSGQVVGSNVSGVSPTIVDIPAISGTYTVRADPWFPGGESYTATIALVPLPQPNTSVPDAAQPYSGIYPRFQNYAIPHNQGGNQEGEPSIGYDPNTNKVLYQAGLQTLKVGFNDATSPASATWQDVTAFNQKASLDPILFTDPLTGRTFASQLTGQDSLTSFSDNDGGSWTPSQGGGIPSGVDHQSIGGGPYSTRGTVQPPNTGTVTGYKDAVYYCSQDIATAFCARSDNGGLTFGPGVPIYNLSQCSGIHGHVKVAPDGTVYVPNRNCGGKTGVAASTDNGATWTVHTIPGSTNGIGNDPSIGIATDGTIYEGYQGADGHARIAVSHDEGKTWSAPVDVGATVGVQGMVFPEVAAGDPTRAAFAFLGTTSPGNFQAFNVFQGTWHLYIATTYDGGQSWATVDATPNDPVQRGSICIAGTTCSNTPNDRNLLDFMDITTDSQGRVLVAYPDGCVDACVTADPTKPAVQTNSFTSYATIARQSGGKGLYAADDTAEPAVPGRPPLAATTSPGSTTATLSWQAPDDGGSPITSYSVYAGTSANSLSPVTSTDKTAVQLAVSPGQTTYYQVQAVNAAGSGPLSPVATLRVVNQNVQCTLPGTTAIVHPAGHQTGYPYNMDLSLTEVDVAEPANLFGWNNLAFTIHLADLSQIYPGHQWRVFWGDGTGAGRWYAGADWNGTTMSFVYGHVTDGGPEGGPSLVDSTYSAVAGYWSEADNQIVAIVPKSGVGNPAIGSQLPGLQARTFAGQGGVDVFARAAAIDVADGQYYLQGSGSCP
jgi:hypothetical protein